MVIGDRNIPYCFKQVQLGLVTPANAVIIVLDNNSHEAFHMTLAAMGKQ